MATTGPMAPREPTCLFSSPRRPLAVPPQGGGEVEPFLRQLRRLPPWLRRQACSCPPVQSLLLRATASPIGTAVVFLQGIALAASLIVLRLAMDSYARWSLAAVDNNNDWETTMTQQQQLGRYVSALFGLGIYHVAVEAYRILECSRLSVFVSQVLLSLWSWVQVGVAILLLIMQARLDPGGTAAATTMGGINGGVVAVLGTVTSGLLWVRVVGYLSHWWYGMGRFVGIMVKVRGRLFVRMIPGVGPNPNPNLTLIGWQKPSNT